jgi:hypothetical protein
VDLPEQRGLRQLGDDCTHPPAYNPCGVHASFCVGLVNAQRFIDPAYPTPICSQEVLSHSTTNDSIFYHDSMVAPDSVPAYPNTFGKFLYGTLDAGAPIQGHTWASAITSSKSESCVADAGHTLPNYLDASQQIAKCQTGSGRNEVISAHRWPGRVRP